ncbi:putative ribonuclease H-like domain-containing protein [Tanacetum coccineum]
MRARKYYQRTSKKITINGSDTAGYDKSKVECYNCHKMGYFTRECRGPRNQDSRPRNQDNSRKTVNMEDTSAKAIVAIDGAGFDWSFMADEEVPTNMALMAFSDSEVLNDKTCSNTCLKSFETLKAQYDNLRIEFNKTEFDLTTYKRGLASVEEQLVFYKKNEVMFCDQIVVLKRDASFKDSEINALNIQIEKLNKEKESNQIKIDNFENASKSLDKLIGSLFAPPTIDLSNSGLKEFQQPEFEGYGVKVNKSVCESSSSEIKKTPDAPIIEEWVSDSDEDESEVIVSDNMVQKPVMNNVQKGTGQREVRLVWNNAIRTNHQNSSNSIRNFTPTTVLTKSGIIPISTARQSSSRAAAPVSTVRPINTVASKPFVNILKPKPNAFQKSHSLSKRPFYQQTAFKNRILNNKVNTAKVNSVNTATRKRVTNAIGEQGINAVKSSACWVWRPKVNVVDHVSKNSRSYICKQFNYVDPTGRLNGCSRHMTGNKSYLTDYQDYHGGFVAFAGNSKGGKITGKRKNSILFTETECLILSPDFKLPDESQVMLKIHRKDNMYSFDLKNIVPSKGLTCLFAKAINDESKLWHRRLGHINFKTMNKLVKGNLVRGLPSNIFENDHTCVACQKGKQHKATLVTDDYSRFSWVFFLAKKDETSGILKNFITGIENQLIHKNRVLVTKPHNKTPYELLIGRTPIIRFMRPFGCKLLILNTLDHLGKFDEKADEGFLVGYSINSKAFRVFNSRTRKVEENLHVNFLENKPNVAGNGPEWLFDIDTLTNTMNYQPVSAGNITNGNAGLETNSNAEQAGKVKMPDQEYILLPLLHTSSNVPSSFEEAESSPKDDARKEMKVRIQLMDGDLECPGSSSSTFEDPGRAKEQRNEFESLFGQEKDNNNTYRVFTPVNSPTPSNTDYSIDPLIPNLEDTVNLHDTGIFGNTYDDRDEGAEADYNNLEIKMPVIGTKKVTQALDDESWVEAMQEELLQFKLLNVWTLVDLPHGKKAIEEEVYVSQPPGFVDPEFPNKVYKVEKALYGLHQAPRAWYETLLTYLLENGFRRGTMDKTLFIKKIKNDILLVQVYVDDIIFGSTKKSLSTEFEQLMHKRFQMSSMGELTFFLGLQVEQRKDGIFLSQDKYVYDILKKFGFSSVKTASTPMETHKPLSKDADGTDVDVHLYRSMIGSLMYLTSSRPDIMFAVCACSRFQVQSKASHMHAVKRIFRYLKSQPTLGLWYPKDSPMDLIAYSDSDYAGASLDRKSTTGGCQFLGCRLISWQCKKQTIVANSTTEAEYIAASNCCGQSTGSEEFHQIVDFLAGSHIRYALTTNPTIYVSLIEQFWQTATVETVNDGEQQITVTVDGHTLAITEASVRRHLQLGEGATYTIESQHTPIASPTTSQPTTSQPMSS